MGTSKQQRALACFIVAIVYALLTSLVTYHLLGNPSSDLHAHALATQEYWMLGSLNEFLQHCSYPGWHAIVRLLLLFTAELRLAATLACGFFALLTAFIMFYTANLILDTNKTWIVVVVAICLLFVSAIYIPCYNSRPYLGQGSPTIWHNPTYNAVKPFGLLSCLVLFKMAQQHEAKLKPCLIYCFLTVVCLIMKPSYFQIQAPAVALYLVIDCILRRDLQFCLRIALTFLPAFAFMLFEAWMMLYAPQGSGSGIAFGLFIVPALYSPSVLISTILLLAFPVYSIIALRKSLFTRDSPYLFLPIMLLVGFCEFAFLLEPGERMYHGNFGWGYYLSVAINWTFLLPYL